jgi:hypothetical protein
MFVHRSITQDRVHQQYAVFVIIEKGRRKCKLNSVYCTLLSDAGLIIVLLVYMLSLGMQFGNTWLDVDDIKVARFDVQDVIVADMEVFDDHELGLILVDPIGMQLFPHVSSRCIN